jgi:hypothetical protein
MVFSSSTTRLSESSPLIINLAKNTLTSIIGVGPYEGFYFNTKIQNNKMLRKFETATPVFEFTQTIEW